MDKLGVFFIHARAIDHFGSQRFSFGLFVVFEIHFLLFLLDFLFRKMDWKKHDVYVMSSMSCALPARRKRDPKRHQEKCREKVALHSLHFAEGKKKYSRVILAFSLMYPKTFETHLHSIPFKI